MQTRSPHRTLRQLAIALRELHLQVRTLLNISDEEWFDKDVSELRSQALTQRHEGIERCEVLLISVFVLLRRFPDDLIDALRPILFRHWKSAPSSLKTAKRLAEEGTLCRADPFCDPEKLSSTIIAHSKWLELLRKENGIRDTLVHRPHFLQIGTAGTKKITSDRYEWTITAHLLVGNANGYEHKNIFPLLLECIMGACNLMTELSYIIGGMKTYDRGDFLFLVGEDNDVVGFWPAIKGSIHQFPLRN